LLAPNQDGRERAVSGVPQGVPGEPGRLPAAHLHRGAETQVGEAPEGPAAKAESHRVAPALGHRAGGAAQFGVCGRTAPQAGRRRYFKAARVFWQIRQNFEGRHQPE
jgi:hypothetical protein